MSIKQLSWHICLGFWIILGPIRSAPEQGVETATGDAKVTVRGTVRDASTGDPVPEASVTISSGGQRRSATTDNAGRYAFKELPPGRYQITAWKRPPALKTKVVYLASGEPIVSADILVESPGEISGRVIDEEDHPLTGVQVLLIGREFFHGRLAYTFRDITTTDDRGEYRLQRAMPGTAYAILARDHMRVLQPRSNVPEDPKKRKRIFIPTYFPSSELVDGVPFLTVKSDEVRQRMDIRMRTSESYCLEGMLHANGVPSALRFEISEQQPCGALSSTATVYIQRSGGIAEPDGKIRICDLPRGDYNITAMSSNGSGDFFGKQSFNITKEDVSKLVVPAASRVTVTGETAINEAPVGSNEMLSSVRIFLQPIDRTRLPNENLSSGIDSLGKFRFSDVLIDDYNVLVRNLPKNTYVKDIIYNGVSIIHRPLRLGSAIGTQDVRLIMGANGGSFVASVGDSNGNPVPDAYVFLVPKDVSGLADLADHVIVGQTDQTGKCEFQTVRPGQYHSLASRQRFEPSPERLGDLDSARVKATEVEIRSGRAQSVMLRLQ